ncbi:LCP family protein [Spirulina sp. CS-785/01]|uniref:LCP family protein n=1 Tax=Spirulina sp. CS-785/01 TaxID=3021716 RepID=UPI00232ABFC8|nr:LCP family protein [Spirulina sp. CS-785/01]MDB9315847.1 LCP family protein [Spirulina sp. CS-785/01]
MPAQRLPNSNASRPPKPTPKGKKRRKKRGGSPWLWIWLGLTGVGMLSAAAGALLAVSLSATPLRQVLLTPEEEAVFSQQDAIASQSLRFPKLTRPVNILILGTKVLTSDLDTPPQHDPGYHALVDSFEGLSDTMLLVRFDPEIQKLSVLSIPRDTYTRIEGYGEMKINAANYHGGAPLAARTISRLVGGVPIDRYVRVNVQGVEKLIDALGGVEVYVPKDMKYTDHSQHLYIDLKEGQQHLNGDEAMQFLRYRYDKYGDIGRVQRQQILMRAIIEQALSPGTLLRVPQILQVIKDNIDTNLSVEEIAALAGFAANTDRDEVQMMMLPGRFNGDGQEGISYWLPNYSEIEEVMAQHFDQGYGTTLGTRPSQLRVAIQDSTGNPEAVATVRQALREQGYTNIFRGDSPPEPLQTTRIIAQRGDAYSAEDLQAVLGIGEVRVESTGEISSDLTIQLGSDWRELKW